MNEAKLRLLSETRGYLNYSYYGLIDLISCGAKLKYISKNTYKIVW